MNVRHACSICLTTLSVCLAPGLPPIHAEDRGLSQAPPLIARGYTDAPSGTAILAGNPGGGGKIVELRIREGQTVKRDEIVAMLSNYARADISIRIAEAGIEKLKLARESMLTGPRAMSVALEEATLETAIEENKLKALERQRSQKPADQRKIEEDVARLKLENQRAALLLKKQGLANELRLNEVDIASARARLEVALADREAALVRSPLDGVVVQIFARQGENVPPAGIAKIVDMRHLRVLADVDELQVAKLALGWKVEVTFRGSSTVYKGRISQLAPTVKRMQRAEPNTGSASDARTVQVEIELDDPSGMPQVLGREARVTFLHSS